MAALTATTPTNTGIATPGAAVAASDTIARAVMGPKGVYLEIINGNAGADNMTITDPGITPAGNPLSGGTYSVSVPAGTNKIFHIRPEQVNPVTGLVTVTHSVTATVSYKLYPVG